MRTLEIDLNTLSKKLKYERSKKMISIYMANYVALFSLKKMLNQEFDVPNDFDLQTSLDIFNERVKKEKTNYLNYLVKSIPFLYELGNNELKTYKEQGFYPYPVKSVNNIETNKSANYIIAFMASLGEDVYNLFKKLYDEDRVGYLEVENLNGLCTTASSLNSCYITYKPRLDYFDSSIIAHEMGHVIHQKNMYERGVFPLVGTLFDETISQYLEISYVDFIKSFDKDILSVEQSMFRSHYKDSLSLVAFPSLLSYGSIYSNGTDLKSIELSEEEIKQFYFEDADILEKELIDFSYAKKSTYFIGFVIASHFHELYKDDTLLGLKKLLDFISTSHIGSLEEKVTSLNLKQRNPYLQKNITSFIKEEN